MLRDSVLRLVVAVGLVAGVAMPGSFAFADPDSSLAEAEVRGVAPEATSSDVGLSEGRGEEGSSVDGVPVPAPEAPTGAELPSAITEPLSISIDKEDPMVSESGTEEGRPVDARGTGPAEQPDFNGIVEFDMTVAGNGVQPKAFASGDDVLGNFGLYDMGSWIFKKYFIGWSDVPDYAVNAQGRLFYESEPVSAAFPEGLSEPRRLYAIFAGGFEALNSAGYIDMNRGMSASDTVEGEIVEHEGFGTDQADKTATVMLDPSTPGYGIAARPEFGFNKVLAHMVFRNPGGIMTNSGTWSDGPKQGASYTHVDLHVVLDERIGMPDVLENVSFTSYQFKPSYVLDENYNVLARIGDSLVQGSPTSVFSFDRQGKTTFIVRVTVRRDGNPVNLLNASASQVLEPMVLTAPGRPFFVSKEAAYALESANESVTLGGYIDGVVKVASIKQGIPRIDSPSVRIAFVAQTYQVSYRFESMTEGKDLPADVLALLPAPFEGLETGIRVFPEELLQTEVQVEGGKWAFRFWDKESHLVDDADGEFVGYWEFVADPVPVDPPGPTDPAGPVNPADPVEHGTTGQQPKPMPESAKALAKALPVTGDSSLTAVAAFAGAAFLAGVAILTAAIAVGKRRSGK
ncbi:SHIRT domain-containing protein [Paraeggerthella hongkongensis]|uniref:Gram-positive cocci surface proteins LPxTG domain-containing protein n=1 Tax=Paraeggerthella hongkongensis TaxID=230658 RepID=A0A3N0BIV4_9ACTN|nr:SHIRT domain-containing protein [Paraeggerthella hongkongensis]RNL48134.1 hypothetical protein DMP08_02965 [Paraeggerthella hongkongensis]